MPPPRPHPGSRLWVLLALAAALIAPAALLLPGQSDQTGSAQAARTGYDPLSEPEQARAEAIAMADAQVQETLADSTRTAVLVVERYQEDKDVYATGSWPRRAEVLVYDYQQDRLVQAVVSLDSGQVDEVAAADRVQPPLTPAEGRQVLDIALADPVTEGRIRTAWAEATGGAPFDSDALKPSPWVFRFDSVPDGTFPGTEECGLHRCAQLMLATQDGLLLDVMPIVDLSAERVVHGGEVEGGS
jgi:hypothetical protein